MARATFPGRSGARSDPGSRRTTHPTAVETEAPDSVNVHIGARIRLRRILLGMSQDILADLVGITFEAIQQYESGESRVTAAGLWRMTEVLDVPVGYFFEGMPEDPVTAALRERRAQRYLQ